MSTVAIERRERIPSAFERQLLGRYELLFHVGSGGMAEVYAARQRGAAGFEKIVAIKRMLEKVSENDEFTQMFLDEGKLAANIASPHVVATLDLGTAEDGTPYIVMELVRGVSLGYLMALARQASEPVPVPVVAEIVAQAARGLHDAHEARTVAGEPLGLVHRDVSPQNILVGADGRARITDFGVARAVFRAVKTSTGHLKGKFGYFSPEQVEGREIDRRSDVFGIGIVAWEALAGRTLFRADSPVHAIHSVMKCDVPPLAPINPEVPVEIWNVIERALRRDRDERHSTAGDFANELRDAARATCGLATEEQVGAYVRSQAEKKLAKLEESIRSSSDPRGISIAQPIARAAPESPRDEADGAEAETSLEVPSGAVARDRSRPDVRRPARRAVVIAILGLAMIAGAAVALLFPADDEEPTETRVASPPPTSVQPASSARAGEREVARDPSPAHASPSVVPSSPSTEAPAVEPIAETTPARAAPRRRRGRRSDAEAPRQTAPAAASTDRSTTTAAATPPAEAAPPRTERRPSNGLVDVDAFDRFVGRE